MSGVYYDTLRHTSGGCDSMRYRIRVVVTPVASSAVAATLCAGQSYTLPSGMVVNIAGTYRDTIRTASGCDSLVTTATIQLRPVLRTNTTASLCAGQTYLLPSGMIVNTSGVYADTVRYIAGCDSLITNINLTIKPIQAITQNASVCAGQYFTLANGMVVNTAALIMIPCIIVVAAIVSAEPSCLPLERWLPPPLMPLFVQVSVTRYPPEQ